MKVLNILPTISIDTQPRMADFAFLGVALEKVQELPEGTFMSRYRRNRNDAKDNILDSSPVMLALIEFIEKQEHKFWRGIPSQLLETLTKLKTPPNNIAWPQSAQALASELRRFNPVLRGMGIEVINETKESGIKNSQGNIYRISKTDIIPLKTSPQSPPCPPINPKPNKHGTLREFENMEGVNPDETISTKSTSSPETKNSKNPHEIYVPSTRMDIVDMVDFKTNNLGIAEDQDSIRI